jgi:hypothetical protein
MGDEFSVKLGAADRAHTCATSAENSLVPIISQNRVMLTAASIS